MTGARILRALAMALTLGLGMPGTPVWAVQPDEVMSDPALEARARTISKELRCLVCRNENIDDSNAELARDLRLLVRERLLAGDTDDEVLAYIVARYGEYVLLTPTTGGSNLVLWASGPLLLILALGVGFGFVRRRSNATGSRESGLTEEEQARLNEILRR